MKKSILITLALCMTAVLTAAEVRIAVVDMDRVFREYYKSRIAEEFINQQIEAARLYTGQLDSQLKTLRSEAARLGTNALNPALSESDRQQAAEQAKQAIAKVKAKENEIAAYAEDRRREFMRLQQEKRSEIINDITNEIRRRAMTENYAFVLDASGKTANGLPAVLVFPNANDISDAVIRELNRSAAKPTREKTP
jgi:Skp family chaperone for outer membrane proteins